MLDRAQIARLKTLFAAGVEKSDEERGVFLEQECADDPVLQRELAALLKADRSRIEDFFDALVVADGPAQSPAEPVADEAPGEKSEDGSTAYLPAGPVDLPHGERIGPYRLLERLGEGGMGTVYLAEQREPVHRRVALKVIKLGMDSGQILARFEAERQALAMMEHDCITRVYDCGTTERGQPYFVMEYVKGLPITRYCDHRKLSIEHRLELFLQVCSGVQHAHNKGVIHRDLTPNNVMVMDQDGQAVVKIIDFGLARATDHRLVEQTVYTQHGMVVGTPEYMSPEQAGLEGLDIDTRTDVYSLGVLLYELLVGELPFSGRDLRKHGLVEMQRIIREENPPKPSTRISVETKESTVAAERRAVKLSELSRYLKGDLDWIVMRALEKDRRRRYETPSAFAMDIRRHLNHEPVDASPPSATYRLRKLLAKHRVAVVSGVSILLAIVTGGVVAVFYAFEAKAQGALAAQERNEARRLERIAKRERAQAQRSAEQAKANLVLFNRLRVTVQLREAEKIEATMYPAWPEKLAELEGWLRERGKVLEESMPEIRSARRKLAESALRGGSASGSDLGAEAVAFLDERLGYAERETEELVGRVRRRIEWARAIDALSRRHPNALSTWRAAKLAIAAADGASASALYKDRAIDLAPQMGLVPIGMNPKTKLWEFYHLRSAWQPGLDPASIEIPRHRPDGSIPVTEGTGIIFVLIPGGESVLGAQGKDAAKPRFDELAESDEVVRRVTLPPCFIARHEMTQAQWMRLSQRPNPSGYNKAKYPQFVTPCHPVEMVDWYACTELLWQHGLVLPSEHEWEHAARGGATTRFFTGADVASLKSAANVYDLLAKKVGLFVQLGRPAEFDDGYIAHSPVGSFRANDFGLFDVHGNVWEWCRDTRVNDGNRFYRGGSFYNPPSHARLSNRGQFGGRLVANAVGLRPARAVR